VKASVIVPVLYTEPQLEQALRSLERVRSRVPVEIVVVADVPDPSREAKTRGAVDPVAAAAGAVVIYRVGHRGFGSALREGFRHATGDVFIPFMADVCDEPNDIPNLMQAVEKGFDVVGGSRYLRGGGIVGNTPKQRFSRLYSFLLRRLGGMTIHDISNAFKAYRRSVVESFESVGESFDISVELTLKAARLGYRIGEIPTVWTNRQQGSSKFRFGRELRNYGRWFLYAVTRRTPHTINQVTAASRDQI
jgi:glycosyltransferase AglD